MEVCIGICTYKRPEIRLTLESIVAQVLPKNITITVVVADNDETTVAKEYIENLAIELSLKLKYVHAPKRNISIARNACLDNTTSPIFFTIDDDQVASKNWISLMLKRLDKDNADVVFGPVKAMYPYNTPKWIIANDFHSHQPVFIDNEIKTGYTGNTLINLAKADGLHFNLIYGRTGGEDTDFFYKMYEKGAKLAYEPMAIVEEPVPDNRLTKTWMLKRKLRMGQSFGQLQLSTSSLLDRIKLFFISFSKLLFCFLFCLLFCVNNEKFHFWLMRGIFHLGVNLKSLGLNHIENY
ncbi:glycosyltransferase family 2 protein [Shewanella vesiculosa]|uniref:glycosyltransferase n=1 Tax=Shewanella vesiculosa TaxID=518738 RepID=UPI000F4DB066|nr:glycosyltransferase family 2 protein [Shewanella vesiculosa]RPA55075.1 glycosyltransferase family 2 protein [Shewanella vesiculosa]